MAAMLTGVKGQRHPIIPLAGNIPVAHIVEPILHPLAVGGRLPLHLFCRSNQAGLQLLRANIPGGHQAENHLRFAPPADRIAVLIFHYLIELTGFFKLLKNLIRNIMLFLPVIQPNLSRKSPMSSTGIICARPSRRPSS